MRYVAGGSLEDVGDELNLEERVALLAEVARAVHQAHRKGLVHRDLKPRNILIDTTNRGRVSPSVVDFGLAREVGAPGLTADGTTLGTPHYMAPEQVRGEARALDARTDVFALGATLFRVLTDQHPFDGESTPEVLVKVLQEDPPTLTRVNPTLPRDLESIVAKCLEKDPPLRYQSARALAEDLDRFLDGEPVLARRAGALYRFRKWRRRHRALVTVGALALAAILAAAGVALWTRYQSNIRAAAVEEFARTITEIEYDLRVSHTLPLHDIRPAKDSARSRLQRIRERRDELGRAARVPGHYAVGKGALLLGDPDAARHELDKAWQGGDRSARVAAALGLAMGQIYARELAAAQRLGSDPLREQRIDQLRQELREPAIQLLDVAGAEADNSLYTRGWLAYLEGDRDTAERLAQQSLEGSPWLYEAWILIGQSKVDRAEEARRAGENEAAMEHFLLADQAFAEAIRIGESDPAGYVGRCQGATRRARLRRYWVGGDALSEANQGIEECRRALEADGDHPAAHRWLAEAHFFAGEHRFIHGDDPRPDFERAATIAERAHRLDPYNPEPYVPWVRSYWRRAAFEMERGQNSEASFRQGYQLARAAIAADPSNDEFHTSLGLLLMDWGISYAISGIDPRERYQAGLAAIEQAIERNPSESRLHMDIGIFRLLEAIHAIEHGGDPTGQADDAFAALDRALSLNPRDAFSLRIQSEMHRRLHGATADNEEAKRHFEATLQGLDRAEGLHPGNPHAALERAELWLQQAQKSVAQEGADLQEALDRCHQAIETFVALNPESAEGLVVLGEALALSPEWPHDPELQRRSLRVLREIVDANDRFERAWRGLADLHLRLSQLHRDPSELEAARRSIEKALEVRPDLASNWELAARIYSQAAQAFPEQRPDLRQLAARATEHARTPPLRPSPALEPEELTDR